MNNYKIKKLKKERKKEMNSKLYLIKSWKWYEADGDE